MRQTIDNMEKQQYKFSIVIANFNSGQMLEECLSSVFSQSYTNYEIIIADGGSTDESINIIKKNVDKLSWWCSEKDNGQSDAFNKGFSHAAGDYYFWLNADDLLMPNALADAATYLNKHKDCKWLTFNTIFVDSNRHVLFTNNGISWYSFLVKHLGPQVDAPTSIFHKDLFIASQKFDLSLYYAMDIDLWMQFIKLGYKYERLRTYFYVFRIHSGSKTASEGFTKNTKNQEKIRQGLYIREKNGFVFDERWQIVSKIIKLFTCKPKSFIDTYKLKGSKL